MGDGAHRTRLTGIARGSGSCRQMVWQDAPPDPSTGHACPWPGAALGDTTGVHSCPSRQAQNVPAPYPWRPRRELPSCAGAVRLDALWLLAHAGAGTTGRGSGTVRAERPLLHSGGRASWATGSRGLLPGMLAPGPRGACVSQGVEDTGRSPGWEGAGGRDRGARGLGHLAWGARAGT